MKRVISVFARERLNDSGIDVAAGQLIEVVASGAWTDWTIRTDADGFERGYLQPTARLRRVADAPWLRLCGVIGRSDGGGFALGRTAAVAAPSAGRLYLFANDIPAMYWNNKGNRALSGAVLESKYSLQIPC